MGYFNNIPNVKYDFTTSEKSKQIFTLPDLTARVKYFLDEIDGESLFQDYWINDGDTPQSISMKFYGTTNHYWTIMYVNNIYDMYHDWPLTDDEITRSVMNQHPGYSKSKLSSDTFLVEIEPYGLNSTEIIVNKTPIDSISETDYTKISVGVYVSDILVSTEESYITNVVDDGLTLTLTLSHPTTSSFGIRTVQTFTLKVLDYLNIDHFETLNGAYRDKSAFGDNEQRIAVSRIDTRLRENETKRSILVVNPYYIESFVSKYNAKMII